MTNQNNAAQALADLLELAPRAEELATRLVAAGPKAAHVSASETHEIADFVHSAIAVLSKLRAPVTHYECGRSNGDGTYEAVPVRAPVADAPTWNDDYKHDVHMFQRQAAATPVADEPLGWKICFTDRDGQYKTVLHGHNAVGDYRSIDPMASSIPLGPYSAALASSREAEPETMEEIHRQERERSPWKLPKDPTLPDSAPVAGEAPPTDWQNALRIAELPEVDEALAVFCNDGTLDNAVGLVQAILDAAPQASEAVDRSPNLQGVPVDGSAELQGISSEAVRVLGIDLGTDGIADVRNATLEQVAALLETAIPVRHFVFCDSPDGPINRISNRSGQEVMAEAIATIRALRTDPRPALPVQPEQS